MPITKSRQIAKLLKLDGSIKDSLYDSDAIVASATIGVTPAAGTAVYSSADTLPTSADNGDQALVSSTNRLYIFTNSGWYNIALINNTPYWITEANSSYDLSTTGTATTITMLAQDSEGINIVYTATADSDFNQIATVTKDSDNGRVFTITPTDSENGTAINGTGTITFRASDGVNLVSTLSSFSIEFAAANSNYTVLLLKADSDGTDNQVDASTNAHTITENGNVTSTAFTPYHPGGYSTFFDGTSSNRLTITQDAIDNLTSGTIECWIYPTSLTGIFITAIQKNGTGSWAGFSITKYINTGGNVATGTTGALYFHSQNGSGLTFGGTSELVQVNEWNHVAVTFSSTGAKLWCNGNLAGSASGNFSIPNVSSYDYGGLQIGGWKAVNEYGTLSGYMADFRIVRGTEVYTGSSYTIPDERLTAISGTSFLIGDRPYLTDGSSNNYSITNSNVAAERFGPYIHYPYSKTEHGGSVHFDGTGDYLTYPNSTDFQFGTGDYTVEAWLYPTNTPGGGVTNDLTVFGHLTASPVPMFFYLDDATLRPGLYDANASGVSTIACTQDAWNHVAWVRESGTFKIYVNGVEGFSVSSNTNYTTSTAPFTGKSNLDSTRNFYGYIKDLRVVKGTAVYTSAFTPPTAPLTAITNTKLLTCTNKNDIWDASGYRHRPLWKNGNVVASNTQRKFATSSAVFFDGSGDFIRIDESLDLATAVTDPLTIEGWVYSTTNPSTFDAIFGMNRASDGNNQLILGVESGQWTVHYSGNAMTSQGSFSVNTWYHFAIVLNDGSANKIEVYIDGTSIYNNTIALDAAPADCNAGFGVEFDAGSGSTPGNYFNGYMQDLRVSNLARYTANFTPPTAEFKG